MHHADVVIRKFFTIVVTLNLVGLILATQDEWQYPWGYSSPLCLGNLLAAVLVRNELFGRILYLLVNKLFAKVRSGILITHFASLTRSDDPVDTLVVPSRLYFYSPTSRRNPFGLRDIRVCVARLPPNADVQTSQEQFRHSAGHRRRDKHCPGNMHWSSTSLDP
jgi:hypothetical protein